MSPEVSLTLSAGVTVIGRPPSMQGGALASLFSQHDYHASRDGNVRTAAMSLSPTSW